jgi:hypothetical protein
MGAGLAGSSIHDVNVNQVQFGDKLQGLASRATGFYIPSGKAGWKNYQSRTLAPNADRVYCMNQQGGVGVSRSQFKIRGLNNPQGARTCTAGRYSNTLRRIIPDVDDGDMRAHGRLDSPDVDWYYVHSGTVYSGGKAGSAFWVQMQRLGYDGSGLPSYLDANNVYAGGVVSIDDVVLYVGLGQNDVDVLLGLSTLVGEYSGRLVSLPRAVSIMDDMHG